MIIKRAEYQRLIHRSLLADELEKETKRLAKLITSETKDCKMGAWCKDCIHFGSDYSEVFKEFFTFDEFYEYKVADGGKVGYCKKHLHEMCPEFESRLNK